jgi:hypothetical protein
MLYTTPGATGAAGACDPVVIQQGTPVSSAAPVVIDRAAPTLVTEAPRGALCDVPGTSTAVVVGNGQRQVVASTPVVSSRSRFNWRRPDPEGVASTHTSGQVSGGTTVR